MTDYGVKNDQRHRFGAHNQFFAEPADKSQFAIIALSAVYKKKGPILACSLAGLGIATLLSVAAGSILPGLIGTSIIRTASGALFVVFGVYILFFQHDEKDKIKIGKNPFLYSFTFLFLTELGDKTQIANIMFAATLDPFLVFVGAFLAMLILSVMAVFFGEP